MSIDSDRDQVLELTQKLLVAATSGDWDTYVELCDPSLTAFEPEAAGNLVDGLDFHHFYFKLTSDSSSPIQSTIVAPHIRIMGDVAVIAYVRLTQKLRDGTPITAAMEETRVWQRHGVSWKHVHFHRAPTGRLLPFLKVISLTPDILEQINTTRIVDDFSLSRGCKDSDTNPRDTQI